MEDSQDKSQDYTNRLGKAFTPYKIDEEANKRLAAYKEDIRRKQEQDKMNREASNLKVNSHRTTIALIKIKLFYTHRIDGHTGKPWYNLQDLDDNKPAAYLALENYIRNNHFYKSIYTHAIAYLRDPEIPNGTPLGTYTEMQAYPVGFFYYYKNPTKKIQYLQNVQDNIKNLIHFGRMEEAEFLESVFKRALYI